MSNDLSERLDRVEEVLDIIVRDAQMVLPESISPAAVRRIRALLCAAIFGRGRCRGYPGTP